jgi:polyisoprenoid-binding protein YceI
VATASVSTSVYEVDPVHTTVEFAVKHMMVATVKGRFREVSGTIHLNEGEPISSWVEASINTASVDTGVEKRDDDLRSENFLAVGRFPTMTFHSKAVRQEGEDRWTVVGDLMIRGVTREVLLDTEFEGRAPDLWGKERIGFTAQTTLSRHDFGLTYNQVLETGGVVVADKVKITIHIEALKRD